MKTLNFAPGQSYNLNFSIVEDTGIERQTVLFAHSTDEDIARVADTSTYISDNIIEVRGSPGHPFKLDFQTVSLRVLSFTLNGIHWANLHQDFTSENEDRSTSTCRCSVYDDDQRYNDIPYCDEDKAYIQPQHWVGYIKDDSVLVTGRCPQHIALIMIAILFNCHLRQTMNSLIN